MKIGLISCTKSKMAGKCRASDMYSKSALFRAGWQYLKKYCDKIYIMSAKYGLLEPEEIIESYNETLNTKSVRERKIWSYKIIKSLEEKVDLKNDNFIILGGHNYTQYIRLKIKNYKIPLENIRGIGNQISILNQLNK